MRFIWKNIVAVVVSYLVIAVTIMGSFSLAYVLLGVDGSYQPGSWKVSNIWIVLSIVLGLGSAWIGGVTCVKIADNHSAPKYLIALIVVFGVFSAMMITQDVPDTVRTVIPTLTEAMDQSVQPTWLTWINPLLGGFGVAWGSGLFRGEIR
ncbi:MAG: hypothetical protein OXF84_13470 [Bacteroidetes bacterium]|nr:hypothetical protein [Bacteroidota bacterium]